MQTNTMRSCFMCNNTIRSNINGAKWTSNIKIRNSTFLSNQKQFFLPVVLRPKSTPYYPYGQYGNKRYQHTESKTSGKMAAWQIHKYGGNEQLSFSNTCRVPPISNPDDILIKIHAASVNPIDVGMRGGYGSNVINTLRGIFSQLQVASEFPLILGRDFSGVVIQSGRGVHRFKPGDQVWGALGVEKPGSHSQYTIASQREISKKPSNISHQQAASLPYVAATTWSAICTFGNFTQQKASQSRVLVNGGSGGIGTFAIQLLKAWGAEVVTTCATDAVAMVTDLGADEVIDYKTVGVESSLKETGRFDFILDTVGNMESYQSSLLTRGGMFVTLVTPVLTNIDKDGLLGGLAKTAFSILPKLTSSLPKQTNYRWAFFIPDGKALGTVKDLVEAEMIIPQIECVYQFRDLPLAYEKVGEKHGRGKTVLDIISYNR
ncbi:unnamed protein product [Owenia fusiformis]|uniref:Uncharacterized protein n=1 Tax=Owenia fusiformis TaxID=6347 RepID=A0A8J1TDT8_OWEFU|nr:unnamed protein product [Owenia fusiformis]